MHIEVWWRNLSENGHTETKKEAKVKKVLREAGFEDWRGVDLAHDRDQWRFLVLGKVVPVLFLN
jgi:hypothetical protein